MTHRSRQAEPQPDGVPIDRNLGVTQCRTYSDQSEPHTDRVPFAGDQSKPGSNEDPISRNAKAIVSYPQTGV